TYGALHQQKIAFDEGPARSQLKALNDYIENRRERFLQGIGDAGGTDTAGYLLAALAVQSSPRSLATHAAAPYLPGWQQPDGSWRAIAPRPPIEGSTIAATALAIRALQAYAPPPHRDVYQASIRRAAAWLTSARPFSNEDRAFQLLGLS